MSNKTYTPGMAIENKPQTQGALGCFARAQGDVAVLLSNAHVLFGSVPEKTDVKVYEPPSGSSCCRNDHIATTMGTWQQGFRRATVQVTGEAGTQQGAETDCAAARLVDGLRFRNEIPQIGMIAGTPPAGNLGVVLGPPFGTAPTPQQYVRFYSPVTRQVSYGTIIRASVAATYVQGGSGAVPDLLWPWTISDSLDPLSEASPNINQFLILPRPAPGESYDPYLSGHLKLYFCRGGDSGSVVVNHENRVIGLVCRNATKPPSPDTAQEWRAVSGLGVVNPIHKVLEQLNVEIPAGFESSGAPTSATFVYMPGVETDPDEILLEAGRQRVEKRLMTTRFGRLLRGKLEQHRVEARRIVLGLRQAMVTWHRHHGPAFVQHCIRNLRDPSHAVPTVINGMERGKLLEVMADFLVRYGSPKLRRDVLKYRELAMRYAADVTNLDDVPEILRRLERERIVHRTQRVGS